jgi:redox-sensitive bicupin YhaK (pirin superfamily)
MNEDRVQPGQGFGAHQHRDMEIVTVVLEGALEHKDSLGHGAVLRPGEMQRITAGTGIFHSEFNPSGEELAHFYQIWLYPEAKGLRPEYEQKAFGRAQRQGRLQLVASRDGRDGSLTIHQDAALYLGDLEAGQELSQELSAGRHAWVQVLRGAASVNGAELREGDGVALSEERELRLGGLEKAEVLVFDLS